MLKSVRMRKVGPIGLGVLAVLASTAAGCGWILGLDEYSLDLCRDGVLGQGEEAVDCGGPCAPCEDKCMDNVRSGSETDVDCGGPCGPCEDGRGCIVGPDCQSLVCSAGTCLPPACDDKVQNGIETDRDCGGTCPVACGIGFGCREGKDCETLVCGDDLTCLNNFVWNRAFSSTKPAVPVVVADTFGNSFIAGGFDGAISFGNEELVSSGLSDAFLAKFSGDGEPLWSRQFGDAGEQSALGLTVDAAGDVVIAGDFTSTIDFGGGSLVSAGENDIFIAKFGADGSFLWGKRFGDAADQHVGAIAVDGDSGIVITGSFKGELDFGGAPLMSAGKDDVFVAKLSGSGDYVWSTRFGDINNDQSGTSVAVESTGAVIVTGGFTGAMDIGSGLTAEGLSDAFVAKLAGANGDVIWSKGVGSLGGNEGGQHISSFESGEILLVGGFNQSLEIVGDPISSVGSIDIFVLKLSNAGEPIWIKGFGSGIADFPFNGAIGPNGNFVLGGAYGDSIDLGGGPLVSVGNGDVFLAEFDGDGNHIWSRHYGGNADSGIISSVAFSAPGMLFATGWFEGTIDLGGAPLKSTGDGAIFLAKYLLP